MRQRVRWPRRFAIAGSTTESDGHVRKSAGRDRRRTPVTDTEAARRQHWFGPGVWLPARMPPPARLDSGADRRMLPAPALS
ncbi:MAG: hypothetical protein MZV64_10095 [Ignavibacteriales bacterium]|nr:hypothetical protein [Ignavibacteriales bacterium]